MFWELRPSATKSGQIVDAEKSQAFSYQELDEKVVFLQKKLPQGKKKLILLLGDNSVGSLTGYLASLRSGHALLLLNAGTDSKLISNLLQIYRPEIIFSPVPIGSGFGGYSEIQTPLRNLNVYYAGKEENTETISPELAVLLSTSGTTGSPKLIRLSFRNLQSNAAAIAEYLHLGPDERPITSLPISYSYGLSVINSHLHVGAGLICTSSSVVNKEFWTHFQRYQCTSFSGVPFTYHALERMRFERLELPSLRTMTQAGGRLDPAKVKKFEAIARQKKIRFFVMYGQTEATARISYMPPETLANKPESIGIPIPGGELFVNATDSSTLGNKRVGEIHYRGPNVMMGYAEARGCLARGDDMGGLLRTGDIGYQDEDGFFYITGRLKRFIKIFGLRVNLDEVEKMLESETCCPVACGGKDEAIEILIETKKPKIGEGVIKLVSGLYKIHHSAIQVKQVEVLPVLSSGKKDYQKIEQQFRA